MNASQNDQKHVTSATVSAVDLERTAKPIGTFAGSKDSISRFRNGELVAADTGDQGGGQN